MIIGTAQAKRLWKPIENGQGYKWKEAYEVGANAVVGVDLDYVELSSAGSMVMLVASGTAVVIEE